MAFVTVEGERREYPEGMPYSAIAADFREKVSHDILLVRANGRLRELSKKLKGGLRNFSDHGSRQGRLADLPEKRCISDAEGLL